MTTEPKDDAALYRLDRDRMDEAAKAALAWYLAAPDRSEPDDAALRRIMRPLSIAERVTVRSVLRGVGDLVEEVNEDLLHAPD